MTSLWIGIMTSLSTIAIGLLSIVLVCQHRNRVEIRSQISILKADMKDSVDKICKENNKAHGDMWLRINHHKHNGGGNVVICD